MKFTFKVQDKEWWLKMIWAGLTDHLLCKTELFLDARFSFLSFWYLQIILYIIISLEKVENKSFKSFQPGLNLTIWPEPWPELKNMFLIWPRGQTDELIGLQLHQVHLVHKLDGLESKLDSWKQELRTVQFRFRTIIRFKLKLLTRKYSLRPVTYIGDYRPVLKFLLVQFLYQRLSSFCRQVFALLI